MFYSVLNTSFAGTVKLLEMFLKSFSPSHEYIRFQELISLQKEFLYFRIHIPSLENTLESFARINNRTKVSVCRVLRISKP